MKMKEFFLQVLGVVTGTVLGFASIAIVVLAFFWALKRI
jgi:hypothetical protein